ncbi:MAG: flippase-like domain-containing protein [Myxococcales bacterium]|nr:MAG: flippase-like domain-containing protein [Myxococcales bacterium]
MAERPSRRSEPSGAPTKRPFLSGVLPRLVASVLIAVGFVWLLAKGGLPLLPSRDALAQLSVQSVLAFVALQVLVSLQRVYRWVYLLRPIAPKVRPLRVMGIGFVGFSAIFLAPLRMGEVVRPYLLAQDGEVTFMQGAGTIFAERVIDGVMLMTLTCVAMTLAPTMSPLPTSLGDLPLPLMTVRAAVYSATTAFIGLFLAMVAFYAAREPARRVTHRVVGLVSKKAASWASATLERIADGLRFLPSRSHFTSFVGVTASYWGCTVLSIWVLLRGVGLPATLTQACTVLGVLGLGSIVPAGPGMFGAYQIAGFCALAMFFPLEQVRVEGAAFIFVTYAVQLLLNSLQFLAGFGLMAKVPAASP